MATHSVQPSHRLNGYHLGDLVAAAEKVTYALGGDEDPKFQMWLEEGPGAWSAKDTTLLDAISDLFDSGSVAIATTNYDDLLSTHLTKTRDPCKVLTWKKPEAARKAVMEHKRSVVHVHGHWEDPQSVIFGSGSYARMMADEAAQELLKQMLGGRILVFVGVGAGIADPNFGRLFEWAQRALPGIPEAYVFETKRHPSSITTPNLLVVELDSFDDLPTFLRALIPAVSVAATRGIQPAAEQRVQLLASDLRAALAESEADQSSNSPGHWFRSVYFVDTNRILEVLESDLTFGDDPLRPSDSEFEALVREGEAIVAAWHGLCPIQHDRND